MIVSLANAKWFMLELHLGNLYPKRVLSSNRWFKALFITSVVSIKRAGDKGSPVSPPSRMKESYWLFIRKHWIIIIRVKFSNCINHIIGENYSPKKFHQEIP